MSLPSPINLRSPPREGTEITEIGLRAQFARKISNSFSVFSVVITVSAPISKEGVKFTKVRETLY